ncbi:lipoprotein [Ornithobacterium rhinotracheale]|uniref:lipoprotein n=1 Tax=Ornithobacterium rhinotracheale TaxID=28251 RepID=UPI004035C1D9
MKKYIFALSVLLVVASCNNDKDDTPNGNNTEEQVGNKEIKIKSVTLTQDGTLVENPLQNGTINLERRKSYRLEFTTDKDVQLIPGNFLKVKQSSDSTFFADFYGTNLNDINEVITLKKNGYKDLILTINQPAVIADYFTSIKNLSGWQINQNEHVIKASPNGKEFEINNLTTRNYFENNPSSALIPLEIDFISEVYLENIKLDVNDEFPLLRVEPKGNYIDELRQNKRNKYIITIDSAPFRKNPSYTFQIPIYKLTENREKGEKIGEITVRGSQQISLGVLRTNPFSENRYKTDFDKINYNVYAPELAETLDNIKFYIQGVETPAIFENTNARYIKNIEPYKEDENGEQVWKYRLHLNKAEFEDDRDRRNFNIEFKAFDVYPAVEKDGKLVKKEGSQPTEVYFTYNFY